MVYGVIMIEKKYVLVIVPTYNRAGMITSCLESIIAQTYPYIKTIIVDDGSIDDTESICKSYISKYPERFIYIYKNNGGCASSRNFGLNYIDYMIDFICFLDSDDRFMPDKLEREVRLLKENPAAGFTYSDYIIFDGMKKKEFFGSVAAARRPDDFAREHFLTNEAKPGGILYRASVVRNRRFREDLRYNEDSEFLQRIAIEEMGVYSDYPGCWVNFHAGSKSRNTLEIYRAVYRSALGICKDYPDFIESMGEVVAIYLAHLRYELFVNLMRNAKWDEAALYAQSSFQQIMVKLHIALYYHMKIRINILIGGIVREINRLIPNKYHRRVK
jgi:glycosyltransferase involved in cell wall biosynthesis